MVFNNCWILLFAVSLRPVYYKLQIFYFFIIPFYHQISGYFSHFLNSVLSWTVYFSFSKVFKGLVTSFSSYSTCFNVVFHFLFWVLSWCVFISFHFLSLLYGQITVVILSPLAPNLVGMFHNGHIPDLVSPSFPTILWLILQSAFMFLNKDNKRYVLYPITVKVSFRVPFHVKFSVNLYRALMTIIASFRNCVYTS